MSDYAQPDFYRFSQDSTALVEWVLKKSGPVSSLMDLGAGSGIIGIELARKLPAKELDLVELQGEYLPFLEKNLALFASQNVKARIFNQSFGMFSPDQLYDLIVCNPPYYLPGKGELPQNPFKARARTFLVDDWKVLLSLIVKSLKAEGRAFVVLKNDQALFELIREELTHHQLGVERFNQTQLMFIELFRLNVD